MARARYPLVQIDGAALESICHTAQALGVGSARAELLTVRAARASAALDGRDRVGEDDLTLAVALVLSPRATRVPQAESPPPPPESAEPPTSAAGEEQPGSDTQSEPQQLPDRVLDAARAALSADLLAGFAPPDGGKGSGRGANGARALAHGRRIGALRGDPRRGGRLDLVATLRAAAPWQRVREGRAGRLAIRKDDFRIQHLVQRTGTTVIFAVDASGSSSLHRLNEAKGAVELLLAESYVRRDRVALISFRGTRAELMLPPTRSLARARRALAGLPGGGGTPLADALMVAVEVARQVAREPAGGKALVVLLTDGRANIARDGTGGRAQAETDALAAAEVLAATGVPAILIDTAPRPSPFAARVAQTMGGRYFPLPVADARQLSAAVRQVMAAEA